MKKFIENNKIIHNQTLVDIINLREEDELLIPVYCRSKDKLYTLPEIKDIQLDYSFGNFKICFGGMVTRYGKNPFPMEFLQYLFDATYDIFDVHDEHFHTSVTYLLFETGSLDTNYIPEQFKSITNYINETYHLINDYCRDQYYLLQNELLEI